MKNFRFNISSFSGIFAGMNEEGKNIDSYLDRGLKLSLESSVSPGFEDDLLKRISIENEFRKEDVKTAKIAKSVIAGAISVFFVLVVIAAFYLGKNDNNVSEIDRKLGVFTDLIERASLQLTSFFGFSTDFQTVAIIMIMIASFALYSVADRMMLRKGQGRPGN